MTGIANRMKLHEKLILAVTVIVVIPLFSVGFFSYAKYKGIINTEVVLSFQQTLTQINDNINYKLLFYKDFADNIVYSNTVSLVLSPREIAPGFAYDVLQENHERLKNLINSTVSSLKGIEDIRIYKRDRTIPTDGHYLFDESDVEDQSWHAQMIAERRSSLWWIEGDREVEPRSIAYIVPIFDRATVAANYGTNRIGFLKIVFSTKQITEVLQKFDIPGGRILILDDSGRPLFDPDGNAAADLAPYRELLASESRTSFEGTVDGRTEFVIFGNVSVNGWKSVIFVPTSQMHKKITSVRNYTIFVGCLAFAMFVISISFVSRLLLNRIYRLKEKMSQVRDIRFENSRAIPGNDEIAVLDKGFEDMMVRIKSLVTEVYTAQLLKKEAELRTLQEQINPHFLYNTLESIKCCIDVNENEHAVDMVMALKALYRIGLNAGKQVITLEEEIKHAEAYIEIQKFRYGNSFEVQWTVDARTLRQPVCKIILQPIIENAIYHGFRQPQETGRIEIAIAVAGENIEMRIRDNGAGMSAERVAELRETLANRTESGGMGLKNVNERIRLHYGDNYGLSISGAPGEGTAVTMSIPFVSGPADSRIGGEASCIPQ